MPGRILSGALPGCGPSIRFDDIGDFKASMAAERYLEERGFSVGRRQRPEPRGVLYGTVDIQKWRNLSDDDREALHGQMTGDGRYGPIVVTLFGNAPPEAVEAFQSPAPTQVLARASDIAFGVALLFAIGAVTFAGWNLTPRPRPPIVGDIIVGKHTNRAGPIGMRAAAREAQR